MDIAVYNKGHVADLNWPYRAAIVALVGFVFLLIMLRTAWVSDDAAITIRTVLNFLNGLGPTFNVEERVQGYTHPLWFLLLSAVTWVVGSPYLAVYILSFSLSLFVVLVILCRGEGGFWLRLVCACVLVFSKAFVDYSSSGLENPLSNALVIFVALLFIRAEKLQTSGAVRDFFFCCSLIYLNRPDLLLLVSPFAFFLIWQQRSRPWCVLKALLLGGGVVIFWTLFSIFYYGFPFPNTAYAKLGAGLSLDARVIQGGRYLWDSLERDPLTLVFVGAAVLVSFSGGVFARVGVFGVVSYIAYVVCIGGDFMSGRFLTAPLSLSVLILAQSGVSLRAQKFLALMFLFFALINVQSTLLSGSNYNNEYIGRNGIADERGFYFQRTGLLAGSDVSLPLPEWVVGDRKVVVQCGELGFESIRSGPGAHIIDPCGLVDPLLARLPAQYDPAWRIGHFYRQLPTDYKKSIVSGVNELSDPELNSYYGLIRLVTRGALFSRDRWDAIVRLNLGEGYSRGDEFRYADIPRRSDVPLVRAGDLSPGGRGVGFKKELEVALPVESVILTIDLELDSHEYLLYVLFNGEYVPALEIPPVEGERRGLTVRLAQPLKTNRLLLVGKKAGEYRINNLVLNRDL